MTAEPDLQNVVLPAYSLILLVTLLVIAVTAAVKKSQLCKITLKLTRCWRRLVEGKQDLQSGRHGLDQITSERQEEVKLLDKIAFLETTNLHNDLTGPEKENLAMVLTPIKFNSGEIVMKFGNDAEVMYFISEGSVKIFTSRGFEICELKRGSYFGTMPFVKGLKEYNLTAVTSSVITKLLALSRFNFMSLSAKSHNFQNSMVEVADQRYNLLSVINGEFD